MIEFIDSVDFKKHIIFQVFNIDNEYGCYVKDLRKKETGAFHIFSKDRVFDIKLLNLGSNTVLIVYRRYSYYYSRVASRRGLLISFSDEYKLPKLKKI